MCGGRRQAGIRLGIGDRDGAIRPAQVTFSSKGAAGAWLAAQQTGISRGTWRAPEAAETRLADYAEGWLAGRDLKPRTRADYRRLLDLHILPDLGAVPLGKRLSCRCCGPSRAPER